MSDFIFSLVSSWYAYIKLSLDGNITYEMTENAKDDGRTSKYNEDVQIYLVYMMHTTLMLVFLGISIYKIFGAFRYGDIYVMNVIFSILKLAALMVMLNITISMMYYRICKKYIICMRTPVLITKMAIKTNHQGKLPNAIELFMDPLVIVMKRDNK